MPVRRGGRRAHAGLNADINVTSLVDVAFVLLIIFMIAAPMMQGGVQVTLPQAATRPLQAEQGMVVTVDRTGHIFVDQAPFTWGDFRTTFAAIVRRKHPSSIYVRGDKDAPYGAVVRVLAVIRQSGVETVGLVTQEEEIQR